MRRAVLFASLSSTIPTSDIAIDTYELRSDIFRLNSISPIFPTNYSRMCRDYVTLVIDNSVLCLCILSNVTDKKGDSKIQNNCGKCHEQNKIQCMSMLFRNSVTKVCGYKFEKINVNSLLLKTV